MQRSSKNRIKNKPQLIIQTADSNAQSKSFKRKLATKKNEVQIKPPMSAKNSHQLKHNFQFANNSCSDEQFMIHPQQSKFRTLQRLQSQKLDLMKSLQILKQGAVSAIVQKQQQILQLKQHIYTSSVSQICQNQKQEQEHQHNKLYQKQLELKQQYKRELQQQIQDLRRQLKRERIRYESELHQKEELISSLYVELDSSFQKIERLQKCDQLLVQKIKFVQYQNSSLLKQLQTSQHHLNNSSQQMLNNSFLLNLSNVTQKGHNRGNSFVSQDALFQQNNNYLMNIPGDHSYLSSIPIKKYSEHHIILNNQEQDYLSNSFISQRIQSIKQRHKQQIQTIKKHYEQQINNLKKIYKQQVKYSQHSQNNNHSQNRSQNNGNQMQLLLKRNSSVEQLNSRKSRSRSNSIEQGNKNGLKFRSASYTNLTNLGLTKQNSLERLGHISEQKQNMYAIQEGAQIDESGTPRYNLTLKDQILQQQLYTPTLTSFHNQNYHQNYQNQNYDTLTTISTLHNYFNNKNSSQKNLFLNYDTISQFTANNSITGNIQNGATSYHPNHYNINEIRIQQEQECNKKLFRRTNSIATLEGEPSQKSKNNSIHNQNQSHYKSKDKVQNQNQIGFIEQKISNCTPQKTVSGFRFLSQLNNNRQRNQGSKDIIRFNTESQFDEDQIKSNKSNHSNAKSSKSIKKDIMLFCVGLVTGGTLFGLGAKVFNK